MLREFTFPKEPVMWLALAAAIINIVIGILQGDVAFYPEGVEGIIILILGFFARSQVTPLADPKDNEGRPLTI